MATAKKKPAAAEPPAPPASKSIDPAPLVDELGSIEKELAPFAGKIKRAELLRSTIRGLTPDTTSEVAGEKFVAMLGPRAGKTLVSYYDLAKKIGFENYAAFATASLETLTKHVKPGVLAFFLRTEQSGTRHLTIVERGQSA